MDFIIVTTHGRWRYCLLCLGDTFPVGLVVGLSVGVVAVIIIASVIIVFAMLIRRIYRFHIRCFCSLLCVINVK